MSRQETEKVLRMPASIGIGRVRLGILRAPTIFRRKIATDSRSVLPINYELAS